MNIKFLLLLIVSTVIIMNWSVLKNCLIFLQKYYCWSCWLVCILICLGFYDIAKRPSSKNSSDSCINNQSDCSPIQLILWTKTCLSSGIILKTVVLWCHQIQVELKYKWFNNFRDCEIFKALIQCVPKYNQDIPNLLNKYPDCNCWYTNTNLI